VTPLRVAFAGDAIRFAPWVPGGTSGAAAASIARAARAAGSATGAAAPLAPSLVDTRDAEPADVAAALRAVRPDAVVALGVSDHDPEPLLAAGAPVLGVVVPAETPPVWALRAAPPGEPPSEQVLAAAAADARAKLYAPGSPGAACDRLVAVDPRDALGGRLWRKIAPPVDDALFKRVTSSHRPPRIVFHGASTPHREEWLLAAKHLHDVRHVAHGVTPDRLKPLLDGIDVALVAHPAPRATFDHRVALHLAAGHLVVAEPLHPRHGLEPHIDYLETADPDALARILDPIRAAPDTYHRIRIRGRLKAERFRASHVWARVLGDFLRDLASEPRPPRR
jgi:hypothetical protein